MGVLIVLYILQNTLNPVTIAGIHQGKQTFKKVTTKVYGFFLTGIGSWSGGVDYK